MDATHYCPFAQEYSIWNATVTALQFWTVDLKPHILSNAIELVYTAFFHSKSTQQLWNLPEEILFGHFVTTLNNTFEIELAQEDEGYESKSKSLNIPTPLRRAPQIYHVSTSENPPILQHHLLELNTTQYTHPEDSHATVLYATVWCSAVPFKESPAIPSDPCLQHFSTSQSVEEQNLLCQCSTIWITTTCLHHAQISSYKILQPKNIFPQLH